MPVAAGEYVAASHELASKSAGAYRVRFEWLNSALAVLSSSTQSGYLFTAGEQAYGPIQAPANTAFVRLRFDHYGDTAGANPAAAAWFEFTNVKVAKAATSGALGSSRTNLVRNPTFVNNVSDWATYGGVTIAQTNAQSFSNTGCMQITSAGPPAKANTGFIDVVAGRDYTASFYARSAATSRNAWIRIEWYDASNNGGVSDSAGPATSTSGWTRHAATFTAPAYAVKCRVEVGVSASVSGEVHYADAVMLTEGTDTPAYFDGSFTASGTKTYAWTGTAHASSSTVTDTTLGSLPPVEWRNILGKTHVIKTGRESLNLGTLEAELLDADLDPATSATLRPGGGARLLVLVAGVWECVFPGEIDRLVVTYDEKSVPAKPPRVSMTVLDNTSVLTRHRRPSGVAAIASLPYVLEGAGVPWSVNGSTIQIATTPASVSTNDSATALDQIALTRDSTAGHAWVNRNGVLVATDAAAGASVRTLDEPRYSDLEVGFSSEACINAVVIDALSSTGETVTYGPYEDAPSISQWGRRERRFTVHGLTPTQIATLGATILTRNANPGVTVQSVTLPMRTAADLVDALRDLGEIVTVSNTAKGIAPVLRVTSVEHSIESEPAKWLVTLRFATSGSVASPTISPAVQGAGLPDTAWADVTFSGAWTNFDATRKVQFRRFNGETQLRGICKGGAVGSGVSMFVLGAGFRPEVRAGTAEHHFPVVANDAAQAAQVWANGAVCLLAGSNAYVDVSNIRFQAVT
jgi:hypothetical protein